MGEREDLSWSSIDERYRPTVADLPTDWGLPSQVVICGEIIGLLDFYRGIDTYYARVTDSDYF